MLCVAIVYFFLLLSNIPWYGCATVYLTIHLFKDIWGCLLFLAFIIKAAINIYVKVFVWTYFSRSDARGWDSESCGKHLFCFIRNIQTVFHGGCTILHFHQQCIKDSVILDPCQHLELSIFLISGASGLNNLFRLIWMFQALFPNLSLHRLSMTGWFLLAQPIPNC